MMSMINDIKEVKIDKSRYEEQTLAYDNKFDKICTTNDDQEFHIRTMERFIDKYIPIRIQSQISETLGAVLDRKYLNKLENFEKCQYNKLN